MNRLNPSAAREARLVRRIRVGLLAVERGTAADSFAVKTEAFILLALTALTIVRSVAGLI